jgi:hypothetical protein
MRDPTIEELLTGKAENPYVVWVELMQLAAVIVNRGSYTITRVEVRFSHDGGSLAQPGQGVRVSGFARLPEQVREDFQAAPEMAMHDTLTPWDAGLRFVADAVERRDLRSPYPVVRWTDRWGTRWEHRLGKVRRITNDELWEP